MVLEALEWGLGCPFADEGHDLAAIGSEPLRRRKGAGSRHTAAFFTLGCRRLPLLAAVTL